MTLAQKVFHYPDADKVVLTTFSGHYTSRDIQAEMDRYISLLRPLELKGKKVGLLVPAIPSYAALVLAINELGGTIIPLSWQFRKEDLSAVLQFLDPHVVFSINTHNGFPFAEVMEAWAIGSGKETLLYTSDDCKEWKSKAIAGAERALEQDKIDFICCSSGSTGTPKGMVVGIHAFDFSFQLLKDFNELKPTDVVFLNAPPNSVFGIASLLTGIRSGVRIVFPDNFELPRMITLMQETACNKVVSTPSIFKAIYTFGQSLNPDVFKKIEFVGLTGEMMTEDYVKQFDLMQQCKFVGQYGSSELGGAMLCDLRQQLEFTVYDGVQYKVKEDELLLKSPAAFSGYYQNPQLTEQCFDEEGWFYTGDLVRLNEKNKLELIGRKKELIKKGGQQVIPGEVEKVLSQHAGVKQAVVIGAPHPVFGEQIVAFVVPQDDLRTDDLYAFCRAKIAGYKVPDRIVAIAEIPVAQGKVDKITLRTMVAKQ
ncbi:class I adenylate-forming enzyme family protein [Paenibacillus validus]|uniref:class I adenylate-forming enzyme family protein n=1 Tax=Paenibacillus validus TaxID=44253 RepID=UPI003D2E1D71